MFGSCTNSKADDQSSEKEDGLRRPKRYEGQRREFIVKQAEQVSQRILVADIAKIEEELSDEEREYMATAAKREEERRREEEELRNAAIAEALSGASGKLSGSLLDRMQGLAKLHEVAKSTVGLELKQLTEIGKGAGKTAQGGQGASNAAPDDMKMPVPEASVVVVKAMHPCTVALLRSKLSRTLGIPLEEVRVVHRNKALKDGDLVPDDTVDIGEEEAVEEGLLTGQGLDLSYLWMVDGRTIQPPSPTSGPNEKGSSDNLAKEEVVKKSKASTAKKIRESDGNDESETDRKHGATAGGTVKALTPAEDDQETPKLDEARDDEVGLGRTKTAKKQAAKARGKPSVDIPGLGLAHGEPGASAGPGAAKEEDGKKGGTGALEKSAKKRKGRLVPGSLLITSVSASGLPDTEKGIFSKQDPYLIVKWAEQEARTTARRDSGKDCSWPKEELALIVRAENQLRDPVLVEVWNDNIGDKKPSPDVLIGKGSFPVKHLGSAVPAVVAAAGKNSPAKSETDGKTGCWGGGETVVAVTLAPADERRQKRGKTAGVVTLTLSYTRPRRKQPKGGKNEGEEAAAGDQTTTTEADEDGFSSTGMLSTWSSLDKKNLLSYEELGAAMSQKLEGFDIRAELSKIDCSRYAQGLINEGFGQRGAFAHVREEHLAEYPMFVPRGARKRLLALSELVRLQMKAEEDKAKTTIETIKEEGEFDERYNVDGKRFFDTRAAMKAFVEKNGTAKAETGTKETLIVTEDISPRFKPPKPRTAAKEKVIRVIEARAEAEERGLFRQVACRDQGGQGGLYQAWNGDKKMCCEKHAFQKQKSTEHMLEERVKETSSKAGMWLDDADRFKNGSITQETVKTVMRDALLLNGLSSPRESDVRMSLARVSSDSQGLQFDRGKLLLVLEEMVRKELTTKAGTPYPTFGRAE